MNKKPVACGIICGPYIDSCAGYIENTTRSQQNSLVQIASDGGLSGIAIKNPIHNQIGHRACHCKICSGCHGQCAPL